jgi:hypothetical protein
MPSLPDGPIIITLTDQERDSALSDSKLYDAVEAFFNDGFVVLENAIPEALVDRLNERMLIDTRKLLAGEGLSHYAWVLPASYIRGVWLNQLMFIALWPLRQLLLGPRQAGTSLRYHPSRKVSVC